MLNKYSLHLLQDSCTVVALNSISLYQNRFLLPFPYYREHKLIRDLQYPWRVNHRYSTVSGNSMISPVCFCFFYLCEIWTKPIETTSFCSTELHYFIWMRIVRQPTVSTEDEFFLSWFYKIQPLPPDCSGAVCVVISWMYKHISAITMKLRAIKMKGFSVLVIRLGMNIKSCLLHTFIVKTVNLKREHWSEIAIVNTIWIQWYLKKTCFSFYLK